MTERPEVMHATNLANAIVDAIERADPKSLGVDDLYREVPALSDAFETDDVKIILLTTACRCAEELVAPWLAAYPDDNAPVLALRAAQAWLIDPTQELAAHSATFMDAALMSFVRSKGAGRRSSWPAHSWFARTCAWLADAPQYGWQSVAALLGLIHAGLRDRVTAELASQMGPTR